MKLIILTSSIFYFLGLQLTHQVELEQPFSTDTVNISIPAEQIKLPEIKKGELPITDTNQTDSLEYCGSNEKTAPWYPFLEELN